MSALGDYFDQLYASMIPDFEQITGLDNTARPDIMPVGEPLDPPEGGFMIPPELRSEILATKLSATIMVADELLNPRPVPPPTRRERFRRKRAEWRDQAARRAFRLIAGYWPYDGEDNW